MVLGALPMGLHPPRSERIWLLRYSRVLKSSLVFPAGALGLPLAHFLVLIVRFPSFNVVIVSFSPPSPRSMYTWQIVACVSLGGYLRVLGLHLRSGGALKMGLLVVAPQGGTVQVYMERIHLRVPAGRFGCIPSNI